MNSADSATIVVPVLGLYLHFTACGAPGSSWESLCPELFLIGATDMPLFPYLYACSLFILFLLPLSSFSLSLLTLLPLTSFSLSSHFPPSLSFLSPSISSLFFPTLLFLLLSTLSLTPLHSLPTFSFLSLLSLTKEREKLQPPLPFLAVWAHLYVQGSP